MLWLRSYLVALAALNPTQEDRCFAFCFDLPIQAWVIASMTRCAVFPMEGCRVGPTGFDIKYHLFVACDLPLCPMFGAVVEDPITRCFSCDTNVSCVQSLETIDGKNSWFRLYYKALVKRGHET